MNDLRQGARAFARRIIAGSSPGPLNAGKRIAIVGLPRSGSSWIAKAVSLADSVSYYFEPDLMLGTGYMYRYTPRDMVDVYLKQQIGRQLNGSVVDEYVIAEQALGDLLKRPFCSTVLVKWVRMGLSLDWVARNYPDLVVVQIVRHPVPQFLSWKERGWDPGYNLSILLGQEPLMSGPLKPYADIMLQADSYWEKAAAFWAAIVRMQYDARREGWIFREHEWYCLDAPDRISWLVDQLGLKWSDRIAEFISVGRKQVSGPGYGAPRDSRAEIFKWQAEIGEREKEQISGVLKYFRLPFYRNLDPTSFHRSD